MRRLHRLLLQHIHRLLVRRACLWEGCKQRVRAAALDLMVTSKSTPRLAKVSGMFVRADGTRLVTTAKLCPAHWPSYANGCVGKKIGTWEGDYDEGHFGRQF